MLWKKNSITTHSSVELPTIHTETSSKYKGNPVISLVLINTVCSNRQKDPHYHQLWDILHKVHSLSNEYLRRHESESDVSSLLTLQPHHVTWQARVSLTSDACACLLFKFNSVRPSLTTFTGRRRVLWQRCQKNQRHRHWFHNISSISDQRVFHQKCPQRHPPNTRLLSGPSFSTTQCEAIVKRDPHRHQQCVYCITNVTSTCFFTFSCM